MKKLVLLALTLLIAGCVSLVTPLDANQIPEPKSAYIYADLHVTDDSISIFGKLSVALSLVNTDTNEPIYVRFEEKDTARLVKVAPGHYKLKGAAFLDHYNNKSAEKPLNVDIQFTARGNTMYYLGDYKGKATWSNGVYKQTNYWAVTEIKDNYAETTAKIRSFYPAFSKIEAIDAFNQR